MKEFNCFDCLEKNVFLISKVGDFEVENDLVKLAMIMMTYLFRYRDLDLNVHDVERAFCGMYYVVCSNIIMQ